MTRGGIQNSGDIRSLCVDRANRILSIRQENTIWSKLHEHLSFTIVRVHMRRQVVVRIRGEPNAFECD